MGRYAAVLAIFLAAGCDAVPQASPQPAQVLGQTDSGKTVYQFRITRSNALGVTPVSNDAIAARAGQICPQGYEELGRRGEATRRISGVIYTDVDVTIVC